MVAERAIRPRVRCSYGGYFASCSTARSQRFCARGPISAVCWELQIVRTRVTYRERADLEIEGPPTDREQLANSHPRDRDELRHIVRLLPGRPTPPLAPRVRSCKTYEPSPDAREGCDERAI